MTSSPSPPSNSGFNRTLRRLFSLTTLLSIGSMSLTSTLLPVHAMTIDWQSYSDQADLPQSQKWRDDMKNKLKQVDYASLPPEQRAK